jgi:hypothetical protein
MPTSELYAEANRETTRVHIAARGAATASLAGPAVLAQEAKRPVRIGFLPFGSPTNVYDRSLVEAFQTGLRQTGLVENHDINMVWTTAGDPDHAVTEVIERGVILRHGRRLWVSFGVTTNPTAEWISRQTIEAFPWDSSPRYLIRDRDTAYGMVFRQRLRAMGIQDKPTAPRSPWQNPYVERLIGTIRRNVLTT